jgi:hypothetical protein
MKKFLIAGITAVCFVLPGTAAFATTDDLSGDIHQGQANSVLDTVRAEVGTAENEQAGEVGQSGEIDQVGEVDEDEDVDEDGETVDANGSTADTTAIVTTADTTAIVTIAESGASD